jgi:hypothetical protein
MFVSNEIEQGIVDTEDQVSDKQRYRATKGIGLGVEVQTIKLIRGSIGTIMVFQNPLMVIDRRVISIMSTHSRTRRVEHLRVYDTSRLIRFYSRIGREHRNCSGEES